MVSLKENLRIVADAEALTRTAATVFVDCAQKAIEQRGSCAVALSGGTTPQALYALLARDHEPFRRRVPWAQMHFFWGDERMVPPEHPDSNYGMAYRTLLSKVPVPPANVHRFKPEEAEPHSAARAYEQVLSRYFPLVDAQWPRFDLVLLGMGVDGHTASLFPGSAALYERNRLAVANWVVQLASYRLTLTLPAFNHAATVVFLVSGKDKAPALRAVMAGTGPPERLPAQLIRPTRGALLWLVDRAAAHLLPGL